MIYVITVVYNRLKVTENFIQLLKRQTYSDIHLVLVDDGSTDGTDEMVLHMMPDATILKGNGNLFWGGGLNLAYKWIKNNVQGANNYLMIANDDTEFSIDYIERAIELLNNNPCTLITGVGIGNLSGERKDGVIHFDFASTGENNIQGTADDEGNCASTRSIFMRVGDFLAVGGFHPLLLPHYGSDYEWTIRAGKKGMKIKSFSSLTYIVHEETTGFSTAQRVTLKRIFSKRSNYNPIYRFNFIILVTPTRLLPQAIVNQLRRYRNQCRTNK